MGSMYSEALSGAEPKPNRRTALLRLAMDLLSLASLDGEDESGEIEVKDGTGPEIYVANRVTPSP